MAIRRLRSDFVCLCLFLCLGVWAFLALHGTQTFDLLSRQSIDESSMFDEPLKDGELSTNGSFLKRYKIRAEENCASPSNHQIDKEKMPQFHECVDRQLYSYARTEMRKAITLDCRKLKQFGKGEPAGHYAQQPYSLCFDPPYALKANNCLVYSFGIMNEWSFDDALANYGCEVFSFDPSMKDQKEHKRPSGVHFYPFGVASYNGIYVPRAREMCPNNSPYNWTMKTLRGFSEFLGHENRTIDVVKLDIEGFETPVLAQAILDGFLKDRVQTLLVEWHVPFRNALPTLSSLGETVDTFNAMLSDAGFEIFFADRREGRDLYFTVEGYIHRKQ